MWVLTHTFSNKEIKKSVLCSASPQTHFPVCSETAGFTHLAQPGQNGTSARAPRGSVGQGRAVQAEGTRKLQETPMGVGQRECVSRQGGRLLEPQVLG